MKTTHPNTEELSAYLLSPNDGKYAQVHSHLNFCKTCQYELIALNTILNQLKNSDHLATDENLSTHLSKQIFSGIVNNTLNTETRKSVDLHLEECGLCMKNLLRYRVQIEESKLSTKSEQHAQQPETEEASNKLSSFTDFISKLFKTTTTQWHLSPSSAFVTFVIILGVSIFSFNQYRSINPIAKATHTADVIAALPGWTSSIPNTSINASNIKVSGGNINWYDGYIETSAIGTVDMNKMKNNIQAEIIAEKTARHIAYAQLVEILNGININEDTRYEDLILKVAELNVRSQGFIRGATVISKSLEWIDNTPKVTITLRLPLYGPASVQSIVNNTHDSTNATTTAETVDSTHIIIDASNVKYTPALNVKILTQNSEAIFPLGINKHQAYKLTYFTKISDAINVGSSTNKQQPVVIKAHSTHGAGSIIVDELAVEKLRSIISRQQHNVNQRLSIVF